MDDDILKVRDMAMAAQKLAEASVAGLSSHEAVCAERYTNIKDRLTGIPRLFEMMEKNREENSETLETNKTEIKGDIKSLEKLVYIGMGVCIAVPTILEILKYVKP